jgi:hypothetical protein
MLRPPSLFLDLVNEVLKIYARCIEGICCSTRPGGYRCLLYIESVVADIAIRGLNEPRSMLQIISEWRSNSASLRIVMGFY